VRNYNQFIQGEKKRHSCGFVFVCGDMRERAMMIEGVMITKGSNR